MKYDYGCEEKIFIKNMSEINLKNIKRNYKNLINLSFEKESLGFNLSFDLKNLETELNANVLKTGDKTFKLILTTGVFLCFKNILDYVFENKTESDFEHYKYSYDLHFLNFYEENTDKSKYLNKIFGETVDSLIFHELGHCALGHCDKFKTGFSEVENDLMPKNYNSQNIEMQADWYGVQRTIEVNLYANELFRNEEDFDSENFYWVIRREYTSIMLSQIILFYSLVEFNSNIRDINFEKMNHPHAYVRVAYLFDSVYEAMFNILSQRTKWEPEKTKEFLELIYDHSLLDLVHFLNNEKFLNLFKTIQTEEIVGIYKIIRSKKHMVKVKSYVPFILKPYEEIR